MTISAAVFDMDGIIFDTERLSFETFKQASEEAGWEVSHEAFLASMGLPRSSIPPKLLEVLGSTLSARNSDFESSGAVGRPCIIDERFLCSMEP